MKQNKKIACSVGILTFNSAKNLKRALESVADFSDVIISDGGSTDATLDIARNYGCTIIEQYSKNHPGSDSIHPIEDFARERNILIQNAKEDWFLWIDSDEYISDTLHSEIADVVGRTDLDYHAYEIPIALQSPDAKITYKRLEKPTQIRLFNLQTGGKFERKIHERFVFDKSKYKVGKLSGAWYVPLSKPDFSSYKKAVDYRLSIMLTEAKPKNVREYFHKALWTPILRAMASLVRFFISTILYRKYSLPFAYYRNQMYSHWVICRILTRKYFNY